MQKRFLLIIFCLFLVDEVQAQPRWEEITFGRTYLFQRYYPQVYGFTAIGDKLLLGCDSGLYISGDTGTHWIAANKGLGSLKVRALGTLGRFVFAGTDDGMYRSDDSAVSWNQIVYTPTKAILISGHYIFAGNDQGFFRSSDSGGSWQDANTGLKSRSVHSLVLSCGKLLAGGASKVYVSSDLGLSWEESLYDSLLDVVAAGSLGSHVVMGGYAIKPYIRALPGILKHSSDTGYSWRNLFASGYDFPQWIAAITTVDSLMFASEHGTDERLIVSVDSGSHWTRVDSINADDPPIDVTSLFSYNGYLFAGGGQVVWRRPIADIQQKSTIESTPNQFADISIYPNPAQSNVQFTLADNGASIEHLSVFNSLGQLVFDSQINHILNWDTKNLPSGSYECTFTNGHRLVIRHVLIHH